MRIGFIVGIGVLLVAVVLLAGTCNSTDEGFPPTTAPATTTSTTTPVAPSTTPPTTAPATTTTEPPSLGTLPPIDDLGAPTIGYTSSVSTVGIDKVFFGMTARTAQLAAGTRFTIFHQLVDALVVEFFAQDLLTQPLHGGAGCFLGGDQDILPIFRGTERACGCQGIDGPVIHMGGYP